MRERSERGPFRVEHLSPGDRYELVDGHPVYCAPTGGDGARRVALGAAVLASDPAVDEAGVDAGYELGEGDLRAPDIAIGHVPDAPGWIAGVPPLAVEYAGSGQDEAQLAKKIEQLLEAGTRWVWVARVLGPRRVEVHERGCDTKLLGPGALLEAPGVLRNPVPLDALFDAEVARGVVLRNLLQRFGYPDLDAVRNEGVVEGRAEGIVEGRADGVVEGRAEGEERLRAAVRDICGLLEIAWTSEREAQVATMSLAVLDGLRARLVESRRWPD